MYGPTAARDVEPNSEFAQRSHSAVLMRINLIFAGAALLAKCGKRNELFSAAWVDSNKMWLRMAGSCCWEKSCEKRTATGSCCERKRERDVYTLFNYYWQSIIPLHVVVATPSMRVEHTHRTYTAFKLAIGGASPICRQNTTTTDIFEYKSF